MPQYRVVNDDVRYYPTLGILASPDDVIELPEAIDVAGLVLNTKNNKPNVSVEAEGVSA